MEKRKRQPENTPNTTWSKKESKQSDSLKKLNEANKNRCITCNLWEGNVYYTSTGFCPIKKKNTWSDDKCNKHTGLGNQ